MSQNEFGVPVKHVSDTAWMVAAYRAAESQRPDRLFDDSLVPLLLDHNGVSIDELLKKTTPPGIEDWFKWFMFIRTHLIDTDIMKLVGEGVDTVVNLACGLDTRPYRLALPPHLRWIEVDFPHVLDHKAQRLAGHKPRCQLERDSVDLCSIIERRALFDKISRAGEKAVIITEGLLLYLPEETVVGLAHDALNTRCCQYWLTEISDARSFRRWQKWETNAVAELADDDVRFKFMPEKFVDFFRPLGWDLRYKQNYDEEGVKLGRPCPPRVAEESTAAAGSYDFGIALFTAHRTTR